MSWVQRWAAWNKIHDRAVYKSASPHLQTQDESFKSHVHLSSRGELPVALNETRHSVLKIYVICVTFDRIIIYFSFLSLIKRW